MTPEELPGYYKVHPRTIRRNEEEFLSVVFMDGQFVSQTPVPDKPTVYRVAPGARTVALHAVSGQVNADVSEVHRALENKNPYIVLEAAQGMSGAVVEIRTWYWESFLE